MVRYKAAHGYGVSIVVLDRYKVFRKVVSEKLRNLTLFRSAVTREQAQRGELLYALKNAFNGALTPMVQCLLETEDLSVRELAKLEAMIKKKRKQTAGK